MSPLRSAIASTILLLAGLGTASAQVASPSLLPNEYVAVNAAVLQWAAPSAIGAGYGEIESRDNPDGDHDYAETQAGARLVWENIGLAGEWLSTEAVSGPNDETETELVGALSVLALDWLSVGLLGTQSRFTQKQPNGTEVAADTSITAVGVSLRLAEVFFLGYEQGQQDVELTFDVPGVTKITPSDERELRAYGAGIRWGTDLVLRAEYYVIEFDAVKIKPDPDLFPSGAELFESTTEVVALEVGWGPVIVGGSLSQSEDTSGDKADHTETESNHYALAWAPKAGLGLVAEYDTSETTGNNDATLDKTTGWTASVVYQF